MARLTADQSSTFKCLSLAVTASLRSSSLSKVSNTEFHFYRPTVAVRVLRTSVPSEFFLLFHVVCALCWKKESCWKNSDNHQITTKCKDCAKYRQYFKMCYAQSSKHIGTMLVVFAMAPFRSCRSMEIVVLVVWVRYTIYHKLNLDIKPGSSKATKNPQCPCVISRPSNSYLSMLSMTSYKLLGTCKISQRNIEYYLQCKKSLVIQCEREVKVRLLARCNCGPQVSPLCEKGMIASIPVTWFYWEEHSMIIISSSSRRSRSRISGTENITLPSRIIFWGWLAGSGFLMGWSWLPKCECD